MDLLSNKVFQVIAFVNHSHLNNEGVLKDISYDILFEDGDRIEDVLENDLRVGANKKMNITEGAVFSIVDLQTFFVDRTEKKN